ncbi:hypothetical protein D3C81_323620 [compost metagenome]
MFQTAGVRFMRDVCTSLSVVLLAGLLGACAHSPDPGGPKSWVVENVASKATAELYADVIKPGVFERSSSKVIDGYTVESGNLLMPDKSVGSLVTVRSGDGGLTAVIEQPGNKGLLVINGKGDSRYTPFPKRDYSLPDTVVEDAKTVVPESRTSEGPYVIEMLIGYSRSAVEAAGGDAHANALAQVESVNLALRNSQVTNVSMKLVGVQVVETNYPLTPDTLSRLPEIFSASMQAFDPDMLYGIFSGHPDDSAVGWAYVPGRLALGYVYGEAFRHEVGHNVGGGHCHEPGGGYNFGFNNGKSTTAQCGNEAPYYSTSAVRDQHGLPLGNTATANMARVWRENADRLSSYTNLPSNTHRIALNLNGSTTTQTVNLSVLRSYQAGVVTLAPDQGPTTLVYAIAGYNRLTVELENSSGVKHTIYLRGERALGRCGWYAMNSYIGCQNSEQNQIDFSFKLTFLEADNPGLPSGIFNGALKMKARNLSGSWEVPINVLVSLQK